jgi:ATP-dependent Clp protease adapter protein ClpS
MDRVQPGYVQLVLHDDEHTPRDFVIGLLRSVFSLSPTDAVEVMIGNRKEEQSGLRHVSARCR